MESGKCPDSCRTLPASRRRAAVFLVHQVHQRQIEACHRPLHHAPARLHPQLARLLRRHLAGPPLHHVHPLLSLAKTTIPTTNTRRPHRPEMTLAGPVRPAYASCPMRKRTCVRRSSRRTLSSFFSFSSCPFCGLSQSQMVVPIRHYPYGPSVFELSCPRQPFIPRFLRPLPHRGQCSAAQ